MVHIGIDGAQIQLFTNEDFNEGIVHFGKIGIPLHVESLKEGLLERAIGRKHPLEQFPQRKRREVVRQSYPEPVLDGHLAEGDPKDELGVSDGKGGSAPWSGVRVERFCVLRRVVAHVYQPGRRIEPRKVCPPPPPKNPPLRPLEKPERPDVPQLLRTPVPLLLKAPVERARDW